MIWCIMTYIIAYVKTYDDIPRNNDESIIV